MAKSWVDTGQNQPVPPSSLGSALGPTLIKTLAEKTGLSEQEVTTQLAQALPGFVDKLTPQGRQAYLDKRREARSQNASIVEIDLVMQGKPMLEYSRDGLPDWDYAVTVTRSTQPERYEIYTSTIQKRLPRFKLPLAVDDRDTVVDLQAAFARCYEQGGFAGQLDYRKDPVVITESEERRWVHDTLVQLKIRPK